MNQPPRPSRPRPAHAPNGTGNGGARQNGQPAARRPGQKPEKPVRQPTMVGQAAKFVFMPEIGRSFESVKFAWHLLVNLVAQIYAGVGLIAKDHPCLDLRNASQFKLFDIIRIAYKSLKWEKESIPQIVIFSAVLAFLFFIVLSLITVIMNVGVNAAHAQTPGGSGNAANDVLNSIFNLHGTGMIPSAFGAMLRTYSNIILILAGLILIWTIITYVVESARQGQAGGKSFNHSWAPVRLVFALALLIPLSSGLNSGQYITLYLAKWGSDLASNVYKQFNNQLGLGQAITQNTGGVNTQQKLAQLFDVLTCTYKYNIDNPSDPITLPPVITQDTQKPNLVKMKFVSASGGGATLGNKIGCGEIPFYSNSSPSTPSEELLNKQFTFLSQNVPEISRLAQDYVSHVKDDGSSNGNYFKALNLTQYRSDLQTLAKNYSEALGVAYQDAITSQNAQLSQEINSSIQGIGWVTAPMWYYRVAQANANVNKAYTALPQIKADSSTDSDLILNDETAKPDKPTDFWNMLISKISEFFDIANLLGPNVYKAVIVDSPNPLSSLISFGNGVFYSAQVAFAGWGLAALTLGLSATEVQVLGTGVQIQAGPALVDAMTPLISAFIGIMFMNGMMLSIILPMMPTVRFAFGVLGWLVIVFVAVMGMPLFALAHLKTGGEGWVGQLQVASAYNMLIGIIIRPTLIVIGLIASLIVFNSVAKLFGIILIGGMQDVLRGNFDFQVFQGLNFTEQVLKLFFFSATITALANTCFKLIDIIPAQAMTWMGTGPMSSFTDGAEQEVSQQTQSFGSTYNQAYGGRLSYNARRNFLEGQALRGGDNSLSAEPTKGQSEDGEDGASGGGSSAVAIQHGGEGSVSVQGGANANAQHFASESGGGEEQQDDGGEQSTSSSATSSTSTSGRSGGQQRQQSGERKTPGGILLPPGVSYTPTASGSAGAQQASGSSVPAQGGSSSASGDQSDAGETGGSSEGTPAASAQSSAPGAGSRDAAVDQATSGGKKKPLDVAKDWIRPNTAAKQYALAFGATAALGMTGLGPLALMMFRARLGKEFSQSKTGKGDGRPLTDFLAGDRGQQEEVGDVSKTSSTRQVNTDDNQQKGGEAGVIRDQDWGGAGGAGNAAQYPTPNDPEARTNPSHPYYKPN